MRKTKNQIIELSLKIEALISEAQEYINQATDEPSMLLLAQTTIKELITDLKRIKRYIKSSGDYELGKKVDSVAFSFAYKYIIVRMAESKLPIQELFKTTYSQLSEYYDELFDIEKDLSDWLTIQERMHEAGNSEIVDEELLEGLTKSRYVCRVSEAKLRHIFSALYEQGYFGPNTTVNDWLFVCGHRKSLSNTIDWTKGQNELVYFIARMFADENENDVWAITSKLFTVKGKTQNPGTLRVVNCRSNIKKDKRDKIDEILNIK